MTMQKITEVTEEHKKVIFGGDSHIYFQHSQKSLRMETQKLFYSLNATQRTKPLQPAQIMPSFVTCWVSEVPQK